MMTENKVALITGSGAKKIGNYLAYELAKKGFSIAIHYNHSQKEAEDTVVALKKLGVQAKSYQGDLTEEIQVKSLVRRVYENFGRIDLLINTAAAYKKIPLEKTTADDVLFFLKVNTVSQFLCAQYVGELMVKQKQGGLIINFADWAIDRPYINYPAYLVSKGAVPTLTKIFANELGKRNPNIRVNCISPGPVLLPKDMAKKEKEQAINATRVKREGTPRNIALAVLHYIENDFVTGQNLNIDGGRSIYSDE